jgi:hypothetical protein
MRPPILIENLKPLPVNNTDKFEKPVSFAPEIPNEDGRNFQYPADNAEITIKSDAIPSTMSEMEILNKPGEKETILKFPGVSAGDTFAVDGPAWYDGNAVLKRFDNNVLELNIKMRATDFFGETGFKITDGKIDLDIRLEKNGDKYKIITTDNNDNGSTFTERVLKVENGKTESGLFKSAKNFIKISDGVKTGTTFTINGPGNISIKTNAMPISLDLIKNK